MARTFHPLVVIATFLLHAIGACGTSGVLPAPADGPTDPAEPVFDPASLDKALEVIDA